MLSHDAGESLIIQSHLCFKHLEGVRDSLKFRLHVALQRVKVLEDFLERFYLQVYLAELGVIFTTLSLKMIQRCPKPSDIVKLFGHFSLDGVQRILDKYSQSTLDLHECEFVLNGYLLLLHVVPCNCKGIGTLSWRVGNRLCSTCRIIWSHLHCSLPACSSGCAS